MTRLPWPALQFFFAILLIPPGGQAMVNQRGEFVSIHQQPMSKRQVHCSITELDPSDIKASKEDVEEASIPTPTSSYALVGFCRAQPLFGTVSPSPSSPSLSARPQFCTPRAPSLHPLPTSCQPQRPRQRSTSCRELEMNQAYQSMLILVTLAC
ncbi:hypothetical protein J3F83DRAFT_127539 [Trichoderma novae-zelandiae]